MNSRLTFAAHILALFAFHERERRRPVTSDELAESLATNPVVVRRMLAQLKAAGLVDSRRGAKGGTVLARDPRRITLRQVYEAVNDASATVLGRHEANANDPCGVAPLVSAFLDEVYGDAEEALLARLATVTIEEMTQQIVDRMARRSSLAPHTEPTVRSS